MSTTNAAEMVIGPAFVTLGGVEMGFTTKDGVEFSEDFNLVTADAPQSLVVFGAYRDKYTATVKVSFTQLSLEKWALLSDYNNTPSNGSLNIAVNPTPTARQLIITCPGGTGKTRTMTFTAIVKTPGSKAFQNSEYTKAPIEFMLIGDAATNKYGTIVETETTGAIPAFASYASIDGAGAETAFTAGSTSVPKAAAAIQLNFNTAIRPDMLDASKIVFKLATGGAVACTYGVGYTAGKPDYTKVRIAPVSALSATTAYQVLIPQGFLSADGAATSALLTLAFSTGA